MGSIASSGGSSYAVIEPEHPACCFLVSALVHLIILTILALVRIVVASSAQDPALFCVQAGDPGGDDSGGIENAESLTISPIAKSARADDDKPDPDTKPKGLPVVETSLVMKSLPAPVDMSPEDHLARPPSSSLKKGDPSQSLDKNGPNGPGNTGKEGSGPGNTGKEGSGLKGIFGPQRGALRQSDSPKDAVDGLGGDIAKALEKDDVLVVWMFDASLSMQADRERAGREMVEIFRALEDRTDKDAFHHFESLLAYGQGSSQLVPSTRKWKNVARKVPNIPADLSGIENTFTCLQQAIPAYRKAWKKGLLFVVWTDESGNDVDQLEYTIEICRQHHVKVSVVGPTSLFGQKRGYQFLHFNQFSGYCEIDRGPETGLPESVPLPYWFCPKESNAFPSGFGPYALVRLSQATAGSFTLYDQLAERGKFRIEDLAAYVPDYRNVSALEEDAEASPLRSAVVQACKALVEVSDRDPPNMNPNFVFWYPPAEYQRRLAEIVVSDLQYVQRVQRPIEEAIRILSDPEVQKMYEYKQEKSPRWRANYLLAKGRLLALSVRYREYELLAKSMLQGNLLKPTTNRVVFQPSKQLQSGQWGEKRSAEAERCLNQCIAEHGKTPWSESASREMCRPFGLAVQEAQIPPGGRIRPSGPAAPPPRL